MAKTKLHPAAAEIRDILAAEREHLALGNPPRPFYHPGYSANVHLDGDTCTAHGVPEGHELDVAAWEAQGRRGAAPLRPLAAPEGDFTTETRSHGADGEEAGAPDESPAETSSGGAGTERARTEAADPESAPAESADPEISTRAARRRKRAKAD